MKLTFIAFTAIVLTFFSCARKQDLRTDLIATDGSPIHCYNNEWDEDETGVDCGGSCAPCEEGEQIEPLCTTATNTFEYYNETLTIQNVTKETKTDYIVYTADFEPYSGTIKITIPTFNPSKEYSLGSNSLDYATFEFVYPNPFFHIPNHKFQNGHVNMQTIDGKETIIICSTTYYLTTTMEFDLENLNLTLN